MTADRLFADDVSPWTVVRRSDPHVCALADRHYARRKTSIGSGRVGGPGRNLVLLSADRTAAWISYRSDMAPADGVDGYRCTMFRNEGPALSSDLILAAEALTVDLWGPAPPDGWVTYVDAGKIASANPGYCFKIAGYRLDRTYHPDRRRRTLIRLRKP